jgi:hypothetical protein
MLFKYNILSLRWIKQCFFFPKFCDIKKFGHVFPPQKLAKLMEFYTRETENSKSFRIFGVEKVQNLLEKNIVKEGPCWKGGIFWFKSMNWNFRTK